MKKSGLSPVVATVLLIAMVVVIGLIIFLWFRGMTQETITKFGGTNVQLVCDDVSFEASYLNGALSISNLGNVPIFSMKVKIYEERGYETKDIRDILTVESENWPEVGLNQGQVFLGDTSDEITGASKIILIPVLLGNSESGQKTFVCDESQYGYEIEIK